MFSIKPLPVHDLLKPFACNQCLIQISTRAMQLRHLAILSIKTTVYKVSSTSGSRTSSSSSTMMSSSSSYWLKHVVRLERSKHFRPLRMQSHVVSSQDFLQVHAIRSITALGAGKPSIQSVSSLSPCAFVSRNQPLPSGVGTSLLRREFFQTAA